MPSPITPVPRPGLLRQIGFFSATALVISNMVGTGIFATTGFMAGDLGSAQLILACWTVGGLFALAGALSYSELGINFPSSGGEYVYLTHAYGPEWGFMTGWVSFFAGFSAPIAAAALAFSDYLGYFFPALKQANASLVIGSGAFSLRLGAGQTDGVGADRGVHRAELSGRGPHRQGAERAHLHQADCDRRFRDHRVRRRHGRLAALFRACRAHFHRRVCRRSS